MIKIIFTGLLLAGLALLSGCNETRSDMTWMKPIKSENGRFLYEYYTGQEQVVVDSAAKRCKQEGLGTKARPGKSYCEDMPPSDAPSACATAAICHSCQTWLSCEP